MSKEEQSKKIGQLSDEDLNKVAGGGIFGDVGDFLDSTANAVVHTATNLVNKGSEAINNEIKKL